MNCGSVMSSRQEMPSSGRENMLPLVSVIIPAFNSARYLQDAVRSVFDQSYSDVECIVIDDGSTDNTEEVLNELSIVYPTLRAAYKTNGGLSSARNMGLQMCSGSYISFLDADDVLLPGKLERQVTVLNSHPDVGIVYGDYLVVTEDLRAFAAFTAEMPRRLDPIDALSYRNWIATQASLIRRTVIDKVGMFDERLAAAEDWDYWIRCARVAQMFYLAGAVVLYRQHGTQMHREYPRMRQACIQVAKKSFCDDKRRLRTAMAAIEWNHAKYLWKQHNRRAALIAIMNCAVRHHFGLHMGCIPGQLEAMCKSPLRLFKEASSADLFR